MKNFITKHSVTLMIVTQTLLVAGGIALGEVAFADSAEASEPADIHLDYDVVRAGVEAECDAMDAEPVAMPAYCVSVVVMEAEISSRISD